MKNVLVSACLLGTPCRWHGRAVRPSSTVQKFIRDNPKVEIVPVCPEELGGLPTPRPPVKSRKGRIYETCADKAKRNDVTGKEVTVAFQAGAEATLAIAKKMRCKLAILCRNSPSCARTGVAGKLLGENGIEIINTF